MEKEFKRKCPKCAKEISYKSKYTCKYSIESNSVCKRCSIVGRKIARKRILCSTCLKLIDSSNYIRHTKNCGIPLIRSCPICRKEIKYKYLKSLIKSIKNNCLCFSCARRKLYSCKGKRKILSNAIKLKYKDPIYRQNIENGVIKWLETVDRTNQKSWLKFISKDYYTDIESKMKGALENLSIGFEHNKRLGKYFVDFLIYKNVIIECDGEYWHKNRENDKQKDKYLKKKGYCVYRFAGKKIHKNMDFIINKIKQIGEMQC